MRSGAQRQNGVYHRGDAVLMRVSTSFIQRAAQKFSNQMLKLVKLVSWVRGVVEGGCMLVLYSAVHARAPTDVFDPVLHSGRWF